MEEMALKRMGDHLHIPEGASLGAILAFPFSPKVLKEAIRSLQLGVAQEAVRLLRGEPPLHAVNQQELRDKKFNL